ncbi:sulfatase [Haladaptatus sp. QDMS2]|uniref:sulfatase family protein n=1 Tax=Haladaptatus sp. QDMS2 TaxID=3033391 RepID=UPI0023E8BB0B|nr:sulfatase-like hydrolase/transferase [Haladaptatus sp. QDMS2]
MSTSRPNIVFVITDQQRMDTIGALGASHMDTPNLDRLAEEGVTFTDCHITAPSCAPSRASLFTGHYPHTTGIYKNGDRWTRSWVEDLRESGYHTVNVGKMHTAPYNTPLGFDERYEVENKDRYLGPVPAGDPPLPGEKFYLDEWDRALQARGLLKQQREFYRQWDDYDERLGAFEWELPEDAHPDVFVGDFAARWLNHMPALDQPLFMQVGFPGPHPPYDPTPEYAAAYMDRDLPMPTRSDADLEGQPPPLKKLRAHHEAVDHDSVSHDVDASEEQLHRQRAYYYANVAMLDEQVGKLLDALEANGYDDTVVVFTSDHGEALGDHGHIQKWTMYDVITNVPTIVWSPDRFESRTVEELVSLFDLGPTVLDLAGVEADPSIEAQSLVPALEGDDEWTGRDQVFAEHARDGILRETQFMTMVRTDDWKLVHFVDEEEGQLFDLNADPDELVNRWDDPNAQDVKRDLLDTLLEWRIRSGVRSADWATEFR